MPKRIFRVHPPRQILTREMSLEGDSTPRQPAAAGFPGLDRAISRKPPAFVWTQTLPSLQDSATDPQQRRERTGRTGGEGKGGRVGREIALLQAPPRALASPVEPQSLGEHPPHQGGRECRNWAGPIMGAETHGAGRRSRVSPKWVVGLYQSASGRNETPTPQQKANF